MHFCDVGPAPGHVALFKLREMNNFRIASGNAYYQFCKVEHADFIIVTDVDYIVHKKIVVKQIEHGLAMVINVAEGSCLAAVTINSKVFMLQRSRKKFYDY